MGIVITNKNKEMKKTILTSIAFCVLSVATGFSQDKGLKLEAFYSGYEDGTYFFEDKYGEEYQFTVCPKSVLKEFELNTEKLISQAFLITYNETTENEEYDDLEILLLKKIVLEKFEYEDDDDEE